MSDPGTAMAVEADSASTISMQAIRDSLGAEVQDRFAPTVISSLMGAAGALVASGLFAIGAERMTRTGSDTLLIIMSAVMVIGAYVALHLLDDARAQAVRPVAVAMIAFGIVGLAIGLVIGPNTTGSTGPAAFCAVGALIAWLVPGTRGRPFLLGMALAAIWVMVVGGSASFEFGLEAVSDFGIPSIVLGVVYLLIMFWLDRQDMRGALSTPFAAVGLLAFVIGGLAIVAEIDSPAGIGTLIGLAGGGLIAMGAAGGRRMTTWTGAAAVFVGLASWAAQLIGDSESQVLPGVVLTVLGLALAGATLFYVERGSSAPVDLTDSGVASTATADVGASDSSAGDHPPAGWFDDPVGRADQRYWDGAAWTQRIRRAGVESTEG